MMTENTKVMKTQLHDIAEGDNLTTARRSHSHEALAGAVPVSAEGSACDITQHCPDCVPSDKATRKGGKRNRPGRHKPDFKGYTLEELRLRRVVNQLKIAAAKDRLMLMVSPQMKGEVKTISGCIRGFDSFMKYFDIAMLAYGVTRRVSGFFRRFSRRR